MAHGDRAQEQPRTGLRASESTPIPTQAWRRLFRHAVKSKDPYQSPKAETMRLSIVHPPLRERRQGGSDAAQRLRRSCGILPARTGKHCGLGSLAFGSCPAVVASLRKCLETQTIAHKALPESTDTRKRMGAAQENAAAPNVESQTRPPQSHPGEKGKCHPD